MMQKKLCVYFVLLQTKTTKKRTVMAVNKAAETLFRRSLFGTE